MRGATGSGRGGRDDLTATAWSVTIASFPWRLPAHTWQDAVGWKVLSIPVILTWYWTRSDAGSSR